MSGQLNEAIRNLYKVFAVYTGNINMTGSPMYTDLAEWNRALFSKSLQQLNSKDLVVFTGKTMSTWGDIDDFKHFLPRLLELTAQLDAPFDVGVLYKKIEYGHWESWKEEERNAITAFNLALWNDLLTNDSSEAEMQFESYFEAIADLHPNLNELLSIWSENNSYGSIMHLAYYIHDIFNRLFMKTSVGLKEDHINEFKTWLISGPVIGKLTDGFFSHERTGAAERISASLNLLEMQRRILNTT